MKKVFKYVGLLLLTTSLISACSKSYLDTAPTDRVGSSTAVADTENAMKSLNGISRLMTTQHAAFGQGFAGENNIFAHYENCPSENYLYNAYASGWADIHNQKMHLRTDSKYDEYAMYYYYQIIGNANAIIVNIDNATGGEEVKKYIKAAALTFRAYAYEKMVRYYCYRWEDSNNGTTRGVPLRLDESVDELPSSTLGEVYAQIYKDLDEAINLYGETKTTRSASQVWLPNVNVAHAVYARAALAKHDYEVARTHATKAKAGFPLMSNEDYKAGFARPTSEWIFGSYGGSDEQNWYWAYGVMFSCNGYKASNTENGGGAIGRELINRIPNNDVRKSLFLTEDKFPAYDFVNGDRLIIDKNYGRIGELYKDKDGKVTANEKLRKEIRDYIDANSPSDLAGFNKAYTVKDEQTKEVKHYYYLGGQLKFWVFDMPGVSYLPFIRTSEMVLIEAEASYKLGDEAKAKAALIELNKTSGRNPQYEVTKSGDALWNEIMDYREVELWGEGTAWSDYKRWNRAIVRKTVENGGNAHPSIAVTINPEDANKWTWDIPQKESLYNKPALTIGKK